MIQKRKSKMLINDKFQERKVQLGLEIFLRMEVRKMIKYKKLLINYKLHSYMANSIQLSYDDFKSQKKKYYYQIIHTCCASDDDLRQVITDTRQIFPSISLSRDHIKYLSHCVTPFHFLFLLGLRIFSVLKILFVTQLFVT